MKLSVTKRAIDMYRRYVEEDRSRKERPVYQIARIILGSVQRTGKISELERLDGKSHYALDAPLFEYGNPVKKYSISIKRETKKGKGRFIVTGLRAKKTQ
ncbi:hypothetical protein FJZ19_03885 [Candidatus Pacearchaeota archaeon]|nr:hypothetical protein [Candidatus Pacearchaeota archaeon]